jgi:tRNA (guanosine-2'-O-)-methyltransferase
MSFEHPPEAVARVPESVRELLPEVAPRRLALTLTLLDQRLPDVVACAEAVNRRHNTSAILRSAEAFGVHEAHLVAGNFKPSAGAAKGAERWLELHFHRTVEELTAALKPRGFRLFIADFVDGAVAPEEVPVDRPVALLFGSELRGVSPAARAVADGAVRIPTVGVTQSLNVSAAASIVLHAVCRRAREAGPVGVRGPAREAFLERFIRREAARKRSTEQLFAEE